jgi:2-dehydro-3-deoxy-D-arabinonate dehydratase
MRLFRIRDGVVAEAEGRTIRIGLSWDDIFRATSPAEAVLEATRTGTVRGPVEHAELLPPVGRQEVWAAGVTYIRSRAARMDESRASGASDFYALVYEAERPELFFKASPQRVAGAGQPVRIRRDARWTVPEPELVAAVSAGGTIFGFTIGNDMTARDIEAQNPLYLPQAKIYDGSCALGPGLLVAPELPTTTRISLDIVRDGQEVFRGQVTIAQLRRTPASLVEYLFRETSFSEGAFLMTGTGIVPPSDFTLVAGDSVRIAIDGIGELVNVVADR